MYDELAKKIRHCVTDPMHCLSCGEDKDGLCFKRLMTEAADAIEELSRQRDRAYARLCGWCGVCQDGKRNAEDCEIAALNPEPPKEET